MQFMHNIYIYCIYIYIYIYFFFIFFFYIFFYILLHDSACHKMQIVHSVTISSTYFMVHKSFSE